MPISQQTIRYRKEHSLCSKCGLPNESGKSMCRKHLDEAAMRTKSHRIKRTTGGICVSCSCPITNGKQYCEYHRLKNQTRLREYSNLKTKERDLLGLCPNCGHPRDGDRYACAKCRGRQRELSLQRRSERAVDGLCLECGNKPARHGKKWCQECADIRSQWYRRSDYKKACNEKYQQRKRLVITHYGEKCLCCGEDRLSFLTIDHINNGGSKHKKELKKCGNSFYIWLVDNDFPEGFQTLCFNCNMSKRICGGICEHHLNPVSPPATESISCCITGV